MKHVTSCFNRGAKLLSDGQLKSIRKRIADDQVVPLRWTKVLTGLDHTLDLADKAKQKKQLQLERQQQQAKQTKKKARSSGDGGGVYSDYSQLQQQAPSYSAQYLQQPPQQYSMPQQQQQLTDRNATTTTAWGACTYASTVHAVSVRSATVARFDQPVAILSDGR